jgi:hypothetical protein
MTDASQPPDATQVEPLEPGDDAPAGTPGTGEGLCPICGGSGKDDSGQTCNECQGTGKVNVGIGGG